MIPALLLATRNPQKLAELRRHLRGVQARYRTLDAYPAIPVVRENGATFEANAIKKALLPSRRVPEAVVIAEDSGLVVDTLHGAPGVRTARFARARRGVDGYGKRKPYHRLLADRDEANNAKLLRVLRHVPTARRGAAFVCVVALARRGRLLGVVRGECRGVISEQLRGATGFGYDPLFVPRGFRRTFAELGPRAKDRLSHRARAMRRARPLIEKSLRSARAAAGTPAAAPSRSAVPPASRRRGSGR